MRASCSSIDLQVQIHVPDTRAPKVISMVGTMQNLVNEVLQAAVGNHFRNTLQGLEAVRFIETRPEVQASALEAITDVPGGVRRRDARCLHPGRRLPGRARRGADRARDREPGEDDVRGGGARRDRAGRAGEGEGYGRHAGPARAVAVGIDIKNNEAQAREAQARGEAAFVELTGRGRGVEDRRRSVSPKRRPPRHSVSRAPRASRRRPKRSVRCPTALVAVANAVADGDITVVPEVLVTGGGGALDGLAATLMRTLGTTGAATGTARRRTRIEAARRAPAAKVKARSSPKRSRVRRATVTRRGGTWSSPRARSAERRAANARGTSDRHALVGTRLAG